MAGKRNKLLELIDYISSLGIEVNIGKNKARGNKGIFFKKNSGFRIDISKNIDNSSSLSTLLHEFAHYLHYKNDSKLKSLDFIFPNLTESEYDELLRVTVNNIPKEFAGSLFEEKNKYKNQNSELINCIKSSYPDFSCSKPFLKIEKQLSVPLKYLLKYDRVNVFNKIYSIDNLEQDFVSMDKAQLSYIRFKNNQNKIARINSRINKLNRYYNQPSELWARFFELYYTDKDALVKIAPQLVDKFEIKIKSGLLQEASILNKILNNI